MLVLRCRYAVDDLRLFKALEQAGMAGRVVVVDSVAQADAVLAVKTKRTGKQVGGAGAGGCRGACMLPHLGTCCAACHTVSSMRADACAAQQGIYTCNNDSTLHPNPDGLARHAAFCATGLYQARRWRCLSQALLYTHRTTPDYTTTTTTAAP